MTACTALYGVMWSCREEICSRRIDLVPCPLGRQEGIQLCQDQIIRSQSNRRAPILRDPVEQWNA